jgi:hypothetical protein
VLVRERLELLAREDPESPVTLEGFCPHAEYLVQDDIYIDHDEGPSAELDEVNICWTASEEVECLGQERAASQQTRSRRLP